MTLPINIKFRVLPRFPAQVIGREGIAVTKQNGIYYFDLDYADFPPQSSIPAGMSPYQLMWDPISNTYVLVPASVTGLADAPNDTNTYGRHALAWVQILPLSGGTMTGPLILSSGATALGDAPSDGTYYGRLNATWASVAPLTSPNFLGTPAAPTATAGTNTTQLATTAFVQSAITPFGTPGQIPVNSQSVNYTAVLGDAGHCLYHPLTDNNARTFTIPANASVAYPQGTVITFVNLINTITIAITTDTMYLAGTGATGSRTLAAYGCCTAMKFDSTIWIISGTGLT
jgi:hypothetical protein